jgi:hypothetical protein
VTDADLGSPSINGEVTDRALSEEGKYPFAPWGDFKLTLSAPLSNR